MEAGGASETPERPLGAEGTAGAGPCSGTPSGARLGQAARGTQEISGKRQKECPVRASECPVPTSSELLPSFTLPLRSPVLLPRSWSSRQVLCGDPALCHQWQPRRAWAALAQGSSLSRLRILASHRALGGFYFKSI